MKSFDKRHPLISGIFLIIYGVIIFFCGIACITILKGNFLIYLLIILGLITITMGIYRIIFRKKYSQNTSYFPKNILIKYDFDSMEGHQFEYYCAALLSKNGFSNVEVTKGSRDQGIDIIAFKDGIKYGIQCKCYSSDIGNKAVQEAFSGKTFYNCHVGAVLTNRYFTASAKELAEKNGVLLWDRDYLEKLIEASPS